MTYHPFLTVDDWNIPFDQIAAIRFRDGKDGQYASLSFKSSLDHDITVIPVSESNHEKLQKMFQDYMEWASARQTRSARYEEAEFLLYRLYELLDEEYKRLKQEKTSSPESL
ncbi:hypothetical protein FACS1894187_05590 [Synergistales bacterium]|nr:hypothetical protein FACS1894187_05590 [Synergistales bacterium]